MTDDLSEKIPFIHVEDEDIWSQIIFKILQDHSTKYEYQNINTFEAGLKILKDCKTTAIALFDLRLDKYRSEHKTILQITNSLIELMKNGIEIFILSAYIDEDSRRILLNQGFPIERIFDKGISFNPNNFIETILKVTLDKKPILSSSKNKTIRLVHLSDLHFGQEYHNKVLLADVRKELGKDINNLLKKVGDIDILAITGDIAFSGSKEEYIEASNFISELEIIIDNPSLMVLIIPGNHDITIPKISPLVKHVHEYVRSLKEQELSSFLSIFEKDKVAAKILLKKQENYRNFAKKYNCDFESYEKPFWTFEIPLTNSRDLRIIGLNTVLFSDLKDEKGKMALSQKQSIFSDETNIEHIVMMHHPLSWQKNVDFINQYFEERVRLTLIGHEHKIKAHINKSIDEFEQLEIFAGAANATSSDDPYEFRYNLLEISLKNTGRVDELKITLWPRLFSSTKKFIPDGNLLKNRENKVFLLSLRA